MHKSLLPGAVGLALLLSGCGPAASLATDEPTQAPVTLKPTPAPTAIPPTPTRRPPDPAAIAAAYPRVDSSTSAHPLQMLVACHIVDVKCEWMGGPEEQSEFPLLFPDPTRRVVPDPDFIGLPEDVQWLRELWPSGTHGAWSKLIDGSVDFILVARQPSEDEMRTANERGVELDVQPVALDAFVFLVNTENPVEDLTLDEVRGIYTGGITGWGEVGGTEAAIQAYQRDPTSGSQVLMETLVMKDAQMVDAPTLILETMMGPINAISEDPYGIGYSVYFYATSIFPAEAVKLIAIDGVFPNSDTIATREYSLTTEVYAAVRADAPDDSPAVMLRDWLLTAEGQAIVEESGYVPIAPG